MKKIEKLIENAIEISQNSDLDHKIGAIIVDGKYNVISTGYNKRKTHPKQYYYAKSYDVNKVFLHAEIDALIKNRKQKPHAIVVARKKKNGDNGIAAPCPICRAAIIEAGIREIIYTTDDGYIIEYIER